MRAFRFVFAVVLVLVSLGGACSDDDSGEDETSPEPSPTNGDEPILRFEVTMIEPIDEAGYLDGLRQREPERMLEFDEAELVELGEVACNLHVNRIFGSDPTPSVEMTDVLVGRDHDIELSERIAPDIVNSASGTVCDLELVE